MNGNRSHHSKTLSTAAAALLILSVFLLTGATLKPRIVAIGDVHGAYDAFVDILQRSQVIDDKGKWVAENAILVQTGDILDRGPHSRKVMDLLMSLEKQASAKKGQVIVLLGNHEVMNMLGDLRYVSPEEFASYTDSNSQKKQHAAYLAYQATAGDGKVEEEKWKAQHPPGFVEHREAFSKNGKYGKWLRKLDAIKVVDGLAFLHGGISPSIKELTATDINGRVHQELELFDACRESLISQKLILPASTMDEVLNRARDKSVQFQQKNVAELSKENKLFKNCSELDRWLINHPEGPLWFRGFATWTDVEGEANVLPMLQKLQISHFVTGHSVQETGQIRSRFGGKVFLIDTGMLSSHYEGGHASALEYRNGKFTAIYPDGRRTEL